MGFCATLPGKVVAVGEKWTWTGDLLNIHRCNKLKATFTLVEILEHKQEQCARIVGTITGWPFKKPPKTRLELLYSLDRKVPISSSLEYEAARRTNRIETRLVHLGRVQQAKEKKGKKK